MTNNLKSTLGNIDIYLFDQLLKGRFDNCKKIIDVGCGTGRNIVYFLQQKEVEVFGIDQKPEAVAAVRQMVKEISPHTPVENFREESIEKLSHPSNSFDLVICNAVLHFAKDPEHFDRMIRSIWRVLKPGGFLFSRLASNIGTEKWVQPLRNRRYWLPDESERFLVDLDFLLEYTEQLKGALYEPIKTTNVQNLRSMTTWCIKKN